MKDTMIGVDLAKTAIQIHAASLTGELLFRKKVRRPQFLQFMASQPPALVVMEACGSAHYWAQELMMAGHEVKLIAPQYVRPFVKRQKNDAADAEAIVIAARQPEMRFVVPKSEDQQTRTVLFRCRDRLARQRTELVNALRSVLYEFGLVVSQRHRSSQTCRGTRSRSQHRAADARAKRMSGSSGTDRSAIDPYHEKDRHHGRAFGKKWCRTASGNDARRRTVDSTGRGSLRPIDGAFSQRPRFRGMARSCSPAVFIRRQGTTWPHLEGWPGRYSTAVDYGRYGACELGKPQAARARHLDGANACA